MQYSGLRMLQKPKGNIVLLSPYFSSTSATAPFLFTCLTALFLLLLKMGMSADLKNPGSLSGWSRHQGDEHRTKATGGLFSEQVFREIFPNEKFMVKGPCRTSVLLV